MTAFFAGVLVGCLLMVVLIAVVACLYATEPDSPTHCDHGVPLSAECSDCDQFHNVFTMPRRGK